MESRYYVYHWCRPSGSPFYVGMGSGNRYLHPKRNNLVLQIVHEIERQGEQVRRFKVYENLTYLEALQLEIEEIRKFGRLDKGTGILANFTDGGESVPPLKGEHHLKGAQFSAERRANMSKARMGNTSRRGSTQPETFKIHLSQVMKGNTHLLGHRHSEETKAKIAAKSRAYHERRRASKGAECEL